MTVLQAGPAQATGTFPSTRRLRAGLRANAAFSLVSGIAMVTGGASAARPWGLGPTWLPPLIGAGVVGFGAIVARVAAQPAAALRRQAALVTAADFGWVIASAVVVPLPGLRPADVIAVAAVAAVVASVAVWQILGIFAARTGSARHPEAGALADYEVIEVAGTLPAAPDQIWPLLTNHDLYGQLALNLSKVEVISEPGEPLRRRCTGVDGHGWDESCTLWEEGRRFAVEIDPAGYPYPMAEMRGLWQVDPHPAGGAVLMRFAYRARPTLAGGMLTLVLRPLFPLILRRILTGWRDQLVTARPAT